jgi:hypothetical protein
MALATLLLLALAASQGSDPRRPTDDVVRREVGPKIEQLVALLLDGNATEVAKARVIKLVRAPDEDGTGRVPVALVSLSVEGFRGGNGHTQYLAAFTLTLSFPTRRAKVSLLGVLPVGGKGIRALEFRDARVEPTGTGFDVVVPALRYGPSDAMCCPSVPSEARFRVATGAGGALAEVPSPTASDGERP